MGEGQLTTVTAEQGGDGEGLEVQLAERRGVIHADLSVGAKRFIATLETAKHRIFAFLDGASRPEHQIVVIASCDAWLLGVLSSHVHVTWALAQGGTLEDRPRYNKSRCFETFPFPTATPEQQARIRALAEQLDAHRKRQQGQHPALTLTGIYNVLEKLKRGEPLSAKEKTIHEQGLVSVLKSLHEELDAAVLEAYGWGDLAVQPVEPRVDETILERLVALNAERAKEEAAGTVRWLRPEFQHPEAALEGAGPSRLTHSAPSAAKEDGTAPPPTPPTPAKERLPWPATLPEQVAAVARVLAEAAAPLDEAALATRFTGKGPWKKRLPQLLDTLVALGRARRLEDGRWMG